MDFIDRGLFFEITSRMVYSRDVLSLCSVNKRLWSLARQCKTKQELGFYNNYHLSQQQRLILRHMLDSNGHRYYKLALQHDKWALMLICAAEFVKTRHKSAVIFCANDSLYFEEAKRLDVPINQEEPSVILLTRVGNLFKSENIGCIVYDEPSKGHDTLLKLCDQIWPATAMDFILVSNLSKKMRQEQDDELELYFLTQSQQFCKMPFQIHNFNDNCADCSLILHYYPFLIGSTGHFACDDPSEFIAKKLKSRTAVVVSKSPIKNEKCIMQTSYTKLSPRLMPTKHLILIHKEESGHDLRRTVNFFQSLSSFSRLNVYILSRNASVVFSIIPSINMIKSYNTAINKKFTKPNTICPLHLKEGMSLAEITAICYGKAKPVPTRIWLRKQKLNCYSTDQLLAIIAKKQDFILAEQKIWQDWKPFIVKDELIEECPCEQPLPEVLSAIIADPRKHGNYTVGQLRDFCKLQRLPITGTKKELALRLLNQI